MSDLASMMKASLGSGVGRVGGSSVGKGGGGQVGTADEPFNPAAKLAGGVPQARPIMQQPMQFTDLMKLYETHKAGPGVKDTSMANGFGGGNKVVPGTGKGGASG